jgi:hypothetical protein
MKSSFLRLTLAGSLMLSSSVLFADTVNTGAGNVWTNLTAGSEAGGNFFSNTSDDGTNCNIGFLLTGATLPSGCLAENVVGNLTGIPTNATAYSYLNNGLGGSAGNFDFTSDANAGSPSHSVTLHLEIAGGRESNTFGYRLGGVDTLLFGGPTANPVSATFTIPANSDFSFWFQAGGNTYYSDGAGSARFALFRFGQGAPVAADGTNLNAYVLGMEDGALNGRVGKTYGDEDFQDLIVSIQVVPEPATVSALAAAVLVTVAAVRRRRKA